MPIEPPAAQPKRSIRALLYRRLKLVKYTPFGTYYKIRSEDYELDHRGQTILDYNFQSVEASWKVQRLIRLVFFILFVFLFFSLGFTLYFACQCWGFLNRWTLKNSWIPYSNDPICTHYYVYQTLSNSRVFPFHFGENWVFSLLLWQWV
jgi:hypothetical protein